DEVDGTPCERIGVDVVHQRNKLFGAVLSSAAERTESHSVARTMTRFDVGGPIALLILNPTDCNVITAGGQAQIIINPSGSKPGYITVDSNGTGNLYNQNNTWALDALGNLNSKIIAQSNPTTGAPGVIRMYALSTGQGTTKAYDPTDVTQSRVSPRPTASSQRVGRDKVDWTYNCVAFGRDGVEHTSDDCKFTSTKGPYMNNLISAIGNGVADVDGADRRQLRRPDALVGILAPA